MYLAKVEERRIKETYKHIHCTGIIVHTLKVLMVINTDQCKKRGCGSVWSTDGLWKLSYPIILI